MGFFSKKDKEQLEKALDDFSAEQVESQKRIKEYRTALLTGLDYYIEALSDLSSLGVKDIRISTGLPTRTNTKMDVMFDSIPTFVVYSNGKITSFNHRDGKEYKYKGSLKNLKKTVQDVINTEEVGIGLEKNQIRYPHSLSSLTMVSCQTILDGSDVMVAIGALSNEETKEKIRKKILEEVERQLKKSKS